MIAEGTPQPRSMAQGPACGGACLGDQALLSAGSGVRLVKHSKAHRQGKDGVSRSAEFRMSSVGLTDPPQRGVDFGQHASPSRCCPPPLRDQPQQCPSHAKRKLRGNHFFFFQSRPWGCLDYAVNIHHVHVSALA